MRRILAMTVSLVALLNAAAAQAVKIGVIGPFSGPFASGGKNFKAGIDAYAALNGAKVGDDDLHNGHRNGWA
jgi:branched-chain amino acid transport system substrate-binding protein